MIKIYNVRGGKRNLMPPEELIKEIANKNGNDLVQIATELLKQAIEGKVTSSQKLELIFSQGGKFNYLFFRD